jgi:hypothetical protein
MMPLSPFHQLSNQALLDETRRLSGRERVATAALIGAIAEVDARRLYLGEGCSSMFAYCTRVLHLSEHAAYGRIEAARLARRLPVVLERLADGSLTLTAACLLAPHLTVDNHQAILDAARHRSKREVEQLAAALRPRPDVPALVRKLPAPKPTTPVLPAGSESRAPIALAAVAAPRRTGDPPAPVPAPAVPARPAVVQPLAPERFRVQFTISRATHDKLRRAQDLLRRVVPNGDPAAVFDRALTLLVADLEKTRLAAARRPRGDRVPARPRSRHVPASAKRAVWERDGGRCAFVGTQGRCDERGGLELHHVQPYAAGGQTVVENLELRCRGHNAYEAELFFGRRQPSRVRESGDGRPVETRSGPS